MPMWADAYNLGKTYTVLYIMWLLAVTQASWLVGHSCAMTVI